MAHAAWAGFRERSKNGRVCIAGGGGGRGRVHAWGEANSRGCAVRAKRQAALHGGGAVQRVQGARKPNARFKVGTIHKGALGAGHAQRGARVLVRRQGTPRRARARLSMRPRPHKSRLHSVARRGAPHPFMRTRRCARRPSARDAVRAPPQKKCLGGGLVGVSGASSSSTSCSGTFSMSGLWVRGGGVCAVV